MADLVKYQKAFQASARIVSIVDQMLDEVIQLKR
jgi:flagellar hook-associated protein FlgK